VGNQKKMKMKSRIFVMLALGLSIISCNNSTPHADDGKLTNSTYTHNYLGWTMELPDNFEFVSQESKDKWSENTEKVVGESYSVDNEQIDLISFKVNEGIFLSNLNLRNNFPHLKSEIQYLQAGAEQTKQGLEKVNISPSFEYDKETIDGKEFTVQTITHYLDNQIINNQKVYLSFDDHYMFLIVLSWKNPEEKAIILDTFNKSKFKK
jgi:hypothetical protein